MRLATHNVKVDLSPADASSCVAAVLEYNPDVFGLVEWGRGRRRTLAKHAKVAAFPNLSRLFRQHPTTGYAAVYPLGGQPILYRADRYKFIAAKRVLLSKARKKVRATYGTELTLWDKADRRTTIVLNVHPVAHHDRPQNLTAWLEAAETIDQWAEQLTGFRRYVLGDLNKEWHQVDGLRSCWAGNKRLPTSPNGRNTIDYIFGPRHFQQPVIVRTKSDHNAVVADEKE